MSEKESEYVHGEMPTRDKAKMYSGFLTHGAWVGVLTAMLVTHLVFVFMTAIGPFTGLIIAAIVGLASGLFLKFKPGFFGFWFLYVVGGLFVTLLVLLIQRF